MKRSGLFRVMKNMNRGWMFFLSAWISALVSLSAQEGSVSLILEPHEAYSGRVKFSLARWDFLGAISWVEDGQEFVPGNLLLRGPWGGVGSIVPRGILKELDAPSLSRAPQPPGHRAPVFDTSFDGSPRRGIILWPAGGSGGASVWSFQDRQAGGLWYEKHPGSRPASWGTGILLRGGAVKESKGWLQEAPLLSSPWFVSAGGRGRVQFNWMSGGTGIFFSAAPIDPPGIWIRLWGELRFGSLKLLLFGGAASPRVWDSDGSRMNEQASCHFSASWKPWKPLTLDIRFSEIQEHPGFLYYAYRRHRSEGEGSLVLAVSSGELRGKISRSIQRDEEGDGVLRDFCQFQGILKPGDLQLLGEVRWYGGREDRIVFGGSVDYGRDGFRLVLQANREREGSLWQTEVGLKVSCGTEEFQIQVDTGLYRPDGGGWQATGKLSLQGKLTAE